ncbi:hypothetical protein OH77DRAFT_1430773 [Trametes cingulata]|nr:hypothetical protein OH77DRAFT_1430773 [Trametes cingulata]
MSFAAPVPRLPLASVLRHLDASWAPRTPDARDADATQGSQRDEDLPQLGLGLVMGAACLPIHLPRPFLESELASLSPSRYSRRLRSLAPAPLQLASPTPRAPFRSLTQAQTPVPASTRRTPCSAAFVDVPLDTQCGSAFGDVSVSPQSERRASISSTMTSQSTAPTSLVFPGESENINPGRGTNPPSYVDLLSWHRSVSRSLDSPLSPLAAKSAHTGTSARKAMGSPATPATPARKSSLGNEDPFTPGLPSDAAPPPLRRTEWVPLPELTDEELPSPDVLLLSPLRADLRLDLGVEDLALRAERCSESIARASLSLCSCSLLREPEAIVDLVDRLRATFVSVQRALDGTPAQFTADGSDAKRIWYAKHWQVIASLDRNLNLFYLLSHQIEERPPRIHRLAPLLDKLGTYELKFADLARRIALSHEKFRFLGLRAELSLSRPPARTTSTDDKERVLRHDARAARQEGRARRREIREEITRVRGRIRAIRERDVDLARNDENMTVCEEDEEMEREKWRQERW